MLGRLQLSFFSLSSDYEYLREHFREKHFLCEEGRCSTEQFTHAFRTEIDYKAHKTACHSKNRAEARQNRQIDLQFNYAPRHQRRSEGKHDWGMRWTETYSVLLLWGFSRTSGEHFHWASPGTGPWEVVEFVFKDLQGSPKLDQTGPWAPLCSFRAGLALSEGMEQMTSRSLFLPEFFFNNFFHHVWI